MLNHHSHFTPEYKDVSRIEGEEMSRMQVIIVGSISSQPPSHPYKGCVMTLTSRFTKNQREQTGFHLDQPLQNLGRAIALPEIHQH
jgi:hypothetical protein